MLGKGLFSRIGAYAVLALGFWLLFQGFERSNILSGILGGVIIIVGMYLMTGVWKDMFARFGLSRDVRKEKQSSVNSEEDTTGGTGDTVDGGDQGGQLPS